MTSHRSIAIFPDMVRLLASAEKGMSAAKEQEEPKIKVVAVDDTPRMNRGPTMRTTETSGTS